VLNGEKCYLTNGGIAELTVVFAKVDGRISAFLVERGDPGVSAGRKEAKLGLRASFTGSLVLEDARIPTDRLLGEEGQGWELALDFFQASGAPGITERRAPSGITPPSSRSKTSILASLPQYPSPLIERNSLDAL
jgi:hypothetical protein